MALFEELKSQWENQTQSEIPDEGVRQVMKKITAIRNKQRITNAVLGSTMLLLVFFFFYISAYKFQTVMLGLIVMIGALLIRIAIEFLSIRRLKLLNLTENASSFKQQLASYSKNRIKVHLIGTPLIIIQYCIGFVMLMPSFKTSLSEGFYNYILISSIIVLLVLSLFIVKQIKNELRILKGLDS